MNDVRHDHSRWGPGDQLGAGNLLTPERRLSALRSIQTGALYDLSHEISPKAPFLMPNQTPFLQSIWASWRDSIKPSRASSPYARATVLGLMTRYSARARTLGRGSSSATLPATTALFTCSTICRKMGTGLAGLTLISMCIVY